MKPADAVFILLSCLSACAPRQAQELEPCRIGFETYPLEVCHARMAAEVAAQASYDTIPGGGS